MERPQRHTVAISGDANDRLNLLAQRSGHKKAQILEWLLLRTGERALVADLKGAKLKPLRLGRRKTTLW